MDAGPTEGRTSLLDDVLNQMIAFVRADDLKAGLPARSDEGARLRAKDRINGLTNVQLLKLLSKVRP